MPRWLKTDQDVAYAHEHLAEVRSIKGCSMCDPTVWVPGQKDYPQPCGAPMLPEIVHVELHGKQIQHRQCERYRAWAEEWNKGRETKRRTS